MRARLAFRLAPALLSMSCAIVAGLEDKQLDEGVTEPTDGGARDGVDGAAAPSQDAAPDVPKKVEGDGEIVASDQKGPLGIVTDDVYVYWTNDGDGTVQRRKKSLADAPELVVSGQNAPRHMLVDNTSIYWNVANDPPDGGANVTTFAYVPRMGPFPQPKGLKIEEESLVSKIGDIGLEGEDGYVFAAATDKVRRWQRNGQNGKDVYSNGAPTPLSASFVAVDATHVYWWNQKNTSAWRRVKNFDLVGNPLAEQISAPLTAVITPVDLRVGADDVFLVVQAGGIYKMSKLPNAVTQPTMLVQERGSLASSALRDGVLVVTRWTTGADGQVVAIPVAQPATKKVIADRQSDPRDVVIDGTGGEKWVYWTNHGDGTVRRIKLP